jgi:two-component system, NarL family, nitrate/nitrite response regulator NarL
MIIGTVRLYCDGLALALERREDLAVVGTVTGGTDLHERIRMSPPTVVVIDVQSREMIEAIRVIRSEWPEIRTIAFAIDESSDSLIQCAEAGVSGYVTCDGGVEDLVKAIKAVVQEQVVCPPRLAASLLRRLASHAERRSTAADHETPLTAREGQVLDLICEGLSNKEIAQVCSISEATVKNHVHNLLEKQKVRSRSQLAARANLARRVIARDHR